VIPRLAEFPLHQEILTSDVESLKRHPF
jgi:hypothetical protein